MVDQNLSPATRDWLSSGRHVAVGRYNIFVHERGPQSAPVILLVHGYPTSSYDWRGVVAALEAKYRLVAPDLLGFGLSDKPEAFSYSLFQQADTLEGLLAALGVTAAHVVSHDMGTSVHSEFLARQRAGQLPFDLQSSTFLNGSMLQWLAHITPFQEMLAANATLPQAIEFCKSVLPGVYVSALQGLMRHPEAISPTDATVMEELLRYNDGHMRLPATAGYMRERYIHADRWLGALENAAGPVQFVWADGDPIAHAEMGRELARRCSRAQYLELNDLGHFLLIEDPPLVARKIAQFIAA